MGRRAEREGEFLNYQHNQTSYHSENTIVTLCLKNKMAAKVIEEFIRLKPKKFVVWRKTKAVT